MREWQVTYWKNMAKSKCASVDTNVLLRWLLGDVEHQEKQVNKLLALGTKYEVADLALNEVVYVLERFYKIERAIIVQNILAVIRHPQFVCNRNLFEKVLPLYLKEPTLSVTDCALLVYARLNNATLLYTFDKKLANASDGDAKIPA